MTTLAVSMARARIDHVQREAFDRTLPREVVVASRPIRPGDPFTTSNLSKRAIPRSGTGKRNVPAEDFHLILEARSRSGIDAGEAVLWTDVEEPFESDGFSASIAPGRRALTLEASSTASIAGLIRTGDHVDFLCEGTKQWIRNIEVLAVDRHYNRSGAREREDASTLTLSVTSEEGVRLSSCARQGGLSWFLKNPGDNTSVHSTTRGDKPTPRIEIWRGGVPEQAPPAHGANL